MKKGLKIAGIAGILVILCGCGIFIFFRLSGSGDKEEAWASETDTTETEDFEQSVYARYDKEKVGDIISRAERLADSEDYEGALAELKIGLKIFPKSKDLEERSKEYASALMTETESAADALIEGEDYLGAIDMVRQTSEVLGENDALEEKERLYEESYVSGVILQADELISKEDYADAGAALTDALEKFPDNKTLQDKREELKQYRLLYLMEVCPPYKHDEYLCVEYTGGDTFMMHGEEYTNGFTFAERRTEDARIFFDLGGEYASLDFDVGCTDQYDEEDRVLNIYLDDVLAFTMPLETGGMIQHITVDLNGAEQMCIEMPESESGYGGMGSLFQPSFGLANMQVCPE